MSSGRKRTEGEMRAEVCDSLAVPDLGRPVLRRQGSDATLVALSGTVQVAVAAADLLSSDRYECDVIDVRGLVPLEESAVRTLVRRTGRLILVQKEPADAGWAGMVLARIVEQASAPSAAPPMVVSAGASPVPTADPREAPRSGCRRRGVGRTTNGW